MGGVAKHTKGKRAKTIKALFSPEPTPEQIVHEIPKRKLKTLVHDTEQAAKAVNLIYVSDTDEGIRRIKQGTTFSYFLHKHKVKDPEILNRIKRLVIPPAWKNVWICIHEDGHLQATGFDLKNRKQYRYHPLWNTLRNHTKFHRMIDFGRALPGMRLQIEKDLAKHGLPLEKILAAIVSLMERTNIRVGNSMYEKLYGSFGLTTLKDKHVAINGTQIKFSFKGKKGVNHNISIRSKRLSDIVKKCRDIPGRELFQYIDEKGNHHSIDSGMVNAYIKKISGTDFTTKDFRTWSGTLQAFMAFRDMGCCDNHSQIKKNIVKALDCVSEHLGNTRTVCKKYYVHPVIITMYENKSLAKYFTALEKMEKDDDKSGLTPDEKLLLQILETS